MTKEIIVPAQEVARKIFLIRRHRVMVDRDLAEMYGVETFNLNKAAKRNIDRFPDDFMFQLTKEEADSLRLQIGILKPEEQSAIPLKKGRGSENKAGNKRMKVGITA